MKLLFITRKFPPSTGGMENFAFDLYTALSKKTDIKLLKWGGSNKALPLLLPYFFVRASFILLRGGIDIVHAQDGIVAVTGLLLSKIFRKPLAVVIHGLDITHKNKLYQMVIPKAVNKAAVVFCISQAAADEAIKRGLDPTKAKVIPLGITEDYPMSWDEAKKMLQSQLSIAEDSKVLLTVGRLVERKGVAWFVENVMPELVQEFPDTVYLIAGDGEHRKAVEDSISRSNMTGHVKLLGRVADELMPALYNGADIFVMPNIPVQGDIEGFGRVLLEASLCNLPVVASGIEGIKDAVADGKNGILVDAQNTQAFKEQIARFLKNDKQAREFGATSSAYTREHYQWDVIAEQYMDGYNYAENLHHHLL